MIPAQQDRAPRRSTLALAGTLVLAILSTLLLLTAAPDAHASELTMGLHLATAHDGGGRLVQDGTREGCVHQELQPDGSSLCLLGQVPVYRRERYRSDTVGLYVRHNASGWQAGALRNSLGRLSVYAAYTLQTRDGMFGIALGGITGYPGEPVRPLVVPSMRLRVPGLDQNTAVRLSLLPAKPGSDKHAAGLHLSVERDL